MPLWLSEDDVRSLVTPADAVPVIEDCFRRMAAGQVELMPRRRFAVDGGYFAVMAATDRGLGVAGLKSYLLVEGRIEFVVCLFDLAEGTLAAMIAADKLGQVRTGAASGVAAKHLARRGAASLGLIGAGWQAESQLAAIRAAVPSIERVVVSSRSRERAEAFAEANGADVAESPSEAGGVSALAGTVRAISCAELFDCTGNGRGEICIDECVEKTSFSRVRSGNWYGVMATTDASRRRFSNVGGRNCVSGDSGVSGSRPVLALLGL